MRFRLCCHSSQHWVSQTPAKGPREPPSTPPVTHGHCCLGAASGPSPVPAQPLPSMAHMPTTPDHGDRCPLPHPQHVWVFGPSFLPQLSERIVVFVFNALSGTWVLSAGFKPTIHHPHVPPLPQPAHDTPGEGMTPNAQHCLPCAPSKNTR